MRKDIIQSKTEPNKNDIWLSEEGLKKYGKDGWEPLGGGIFPSTPVITEVSGNELVPINVDGENKAISIEQIKNNVLTIPSKYKFVDLGLPSGIKWATCNVGANSPEETGLYFAWGEIEGYTGITDNKRFKWNDYNLCGGSKTTLTKYNTNSSNGTVDNLTILEQVDDAAYQSDNTCRMPTNDDFKELEDNTTSTQETLNGVNGTRFISNVNGNSIFIPAAGYYYLGSLNNVGSYGYLWSSSLYKYSTTYAHHLYFAQDNNYVNNSSTHRCNGLPIRPVQAPNTSPITINLKELQDTVDNLEIQAKDAKEVYIFDLDNYKTPEDYNNLKAAVDANKLIISQGVIFSLVELPNGSLMGITHVIAGVPGDNSPQLQIDGVIVMFGTDGQVVRTDNEFIFDGTGDGTKFLSDDGTYKEVSGGSEPVIIEYPFEGTEAVTLTDEQIEAVKNGNIKIKFTMTGTTNCIFLNPITIAVMEEVAEIILRTYVGENITDSTLLVDFTNKTITGSV